MPWLPLSVMVAGLPIVFLALDSFDQLVLYQRANHTEAWQADGCPQPFFSFRRNWATQRCSFVWTFRDPAWVRDDAEAAKRLRKMRRYVFLWYLVVLPIYAGALAVAVSRS